MRRIVIPALAVIVMISVGCTTAMVPVGTNTYPGERLAVQMIVGQEMPRFDRDDPFTPIHVTLRNNTGRPVQLRYAYFTLEDPVGRQYIIAPVRRVFDWLEYERFSSFYGAYYPRPIGRYVFREGVLQPGREIQAVMFFHQATRYGQGTYRLVAHIPENPKPLEFTFRLY